MATAANTTTTGLGIDYKGVAEVKAAIQAYEKELTGLKLGASAQQITNAIKGAQAVAAVSTATSTCNAAIKRAIDVLKNYEDDMSKVYTAYKKEDATLATNMTTSVSKSAKS